MTSPTDIFRNSVWSVLNSVHTAMPGIVQSYDPATNKATIQPALNKAYESGPMPMGLMENVPIMFQSGSNFAINFPITVGDYVLLVFCERSIDLWKAVGGQVTPDDPRKFNLSDAIAIPGLMPFTGDFSRNNGEDFIISFAGSEIRIKANGDIQIKTSNKVAIGNETVELLQEISDTLAGIAAITTTIIVPPSGGIPFPGEAFPIDNAATFNTIKTQIDSIKGTIT
jgi:hypothetical protein